MKNRFFLWILPVIFSNPGVAQPVPDSLAWSHARSDSFLPVEVVGAAPQLLQKAYSPSSLVVLQLPDQAPEPVSVLLTRVPGLELKDYGGTGGLKTIAARGTTSQQNLVVLDGMIVNDGLSGTANLSLFPSTQLGSVAVQTGGFAADVANGGLGSTVYLNSRQIPATHTRMTAEAGSFGSRQVLISQDVLAGAFSGSVQAGTAASEGNFPFGGGKIRRNQAFDGQTGFGQAGWTTGWMTASVSLAWNRQTQGVPGPVFEGNPFSSDASLVSEDRRLIPSFAFPAFSGSLRFAGLIRNQKMSYRDPVSPVPVSEFTERETSFRADFLKQEAVVPWNAGVYFRNLDAAADIWRGKPETDNLTRKTAAVFSSATIPLSDPVSVILSGRAEGGKGAQTSGSGSAALSVKGSRIHLLLSVNRNIRYPSLGEIRIRTTTDQKLTPEKLVGTDAELTFPFSTGWLRVKGFWYRIQDKIIAIPKNPVLWSAINADQVSGAGIEQTADWTSGAWSVSQYATLQSVTTQKGISRQAEGKQVVYTPRFTAGITGVWNPGVWQISTAWRWTGDRFAGVENLPEDRLPSFVTGDFEVRRKWSFSWISLTPSVAVRNLTSQNYEWIKSYPMPGRSWLMTLTVESPP